MAREEMSRSEFVKQTVVRTLPDYLRIYCAPYTVSQAQAKCLSDAESLADKMFGVITVMPERTELMLPPSSLHIHSSGDSGVSDSIPITTRPIQAVARSAQATARPVQTVGRPVQTAVRTGHTFRTSAERRAKFVAILNRK